MYESAPHKRSQAIRTANRRALVLEIRRRTVATGQTAKQWLDEIRAEDDAIGPTVEEARARAQTVPGSRFSAFLYEPILWWAERAGNGDRRRELLARARGRVLEIGAGTGLNLSHYPDRLERLVVAEPEENMARRLERRLSSLGRSAEVVRAAADVLPFEDGAFDTVVSTLVLCTVEDPRASLAEISRVLRPGGSLLFLEHVLSEEPRLARWQERLHGPWKSFADGCNCNRRTLELIGAADLEVTVIERAVWRRMPPIVRPLVMGCGLAAASQRESKGRRP